MADHSGCFRGNIQGCRCREINEYHWTAAITFLTKACCRKPYVSVQERSLYLYRCWQRASDLTHVKVITGVCIFLGKTATRN